ncbi:class C sortase [Bifidobacterium sp. ESL0784]|uniref:class C sortase n=1 Tax=Bifidobacterium sp. ESL0784 TaxID=2983231 RepID=UPI0023F8896A|nr:class C sortase [Bifidobacterium sp. ESL0784]MDF7640761.1 class C sortase [Bifidobacterium sp. ESL0784]
MQFSDFDAMLRGEITQPSRSRKIAMRIVDVLLVCCAVSLVVAIAWFPTVWTIQTYRQSRLVDDSVSHVERWPRGKVVGEYHRAQAYNRRIAASGQKTLGEFADPFASGGFSGSSSAKPKTQSDDDSEYQSLLNAGDGVMGNVRIPKISVNMPIYHGTSDGALLHGAGHLYGTSLPVGGKSTNAVLSGHRGLSSALLFTRLDELKRGDIFYVQTLGRTMGYRVTGIHVIDPQDTRLYRVVPGRDLVTLMTCTPYAINTQRLIITGTRQSIPDPIPNPNNAKGDPMLIAILVALAVLVVGLAAVTLTRRNSATVRARARHRLVDPAPSLSVFPRNFSEISPQDILY